MAVEDKYVDANVVAGKKGSALTTGTGAETVTMVATVAVAAADDDGSVYRVFADVPSTYVPLNICIHTTAITAGTDYDLGIYKPNGGAVVDKDILMDGQTMATAITVGTWNNLGMGILGIANGLQSLGTLSAQTDVDASYDLALTANTVGTAAGTIRVTATFAVL